MVAGTVAALLVLTGAALVLSSAVLASHRARAAADLAALAGAAVLIRGGGAAQACTAAAREARANAATLRACRAQADGTLSVVTVVPAPLTSGRVATAYARAGPPGGGAP